MALWFYDCRVSVARQRRAPEVAPDAELGLQQRAAGRVALRQRLQRQHARACGQEAAPEDAAAQEGGALLDRQQQAADGRAERHRHACGRAGRVDGLNPTLPAAGRRDGRAKRHRHACGVAAAAAHAPAVALRGLRRRP